MGTLVKKIDSKEAFDYNLDLNTSGFVHFLFVGLILIYDSQSLLFALCHDHNIHSTTSRFNHITYNPKPPNPILPHNQSRIAGDTRSSATLSHQTHIVHG